MRQWKQLDETLAYPAIFLQYQMLCPAQNPCDPSMCVRILLSRNPRPEKSETLQVIKTPFPDYDIISINYLNGGVLTCGYHLRKIRVESNTSDWRAMTSESKLRWWSRNHLWRNASFSTTGPSAIHCYSKNENKIRIWTKPGRKCSRCLTNQSSVGHLLNLWFAFQDLQFAFVIEL